MHDPYAHRRGEPRTFAAAWVAYLFGGLAATLLGVGSLGLVATDVYRAAARMIVAITVVAIWIFWPMLRLSQERPGRVVSAFGADWVLVVLPAWAIVWPQTFAWMAAWPAGVCLGLSLLMSGWAAWAAAIMTWYFGRAGLAEEPAPARWVVMLGMVLVTVAGPGLSIAVRGLLGGAGGEGGGDPSVDWLMMSSPVGGAMAIVADKSDMGEAAVMTGGQWVFTLVFLASGLFAWGLGALAAREDA